MATVKSTFFAVPRQEVPAITPQIPSSYAEALSEGWYVVSEKTPIVHGKGVITMRNDVLPHAIRIEYTANNHGYQYGAPQVVTE